jgi:hypothetical protein
MWARIWQATVIAELPRMVVIFTALSIGVIVTTRVGQADHVAGVTYIGTHSGGGMVEFTVSADGSGLTSFVAEHFQAGPCMRGRERVTYQSLGIQNHQFRDNDPRWVAPAGSFLSDGRAEGTFTFSDPNRPECSTSSPLTWAARAAAAVAAPAAAPSAQGNVLLADNFDDPARGVLPRSSASPALYRFAYEGGEYVIQKLDPNWDRLPTASLPGEYGDASIAVDVRIIGDVANRYVAIACRRRPTMGSSEYRLSLYTADGTFTLSRWDDGTHVQLTGGPSTVIRRGNASNRFELSCISNTISASINGTQVTSVQDNTYQRGSMFIGASRYAGRMLTAEARFDNLVVTGPPGATVPALSRPSMQFPDAVRPAPVASASRSSVAHQTYSGRITVDGATVPPGFAVSAWVNDRECGRAVSDLPGFYSVEVASATSIEGCAMAMSRVRLVVESDLGFSLPVAATQPFQPGARSTVNIAVDTSELPADEQNVALSGWFWERLDRILISPDCFRDLMSDRNWNAARQAIQMWMDAAANRGLLARFAPGLEACTDVEPNIVFSEADVPSRVGDAVLAQVFRADRSACAPTDGCLVFTGSIVFNRAAIADQTDEELARLTARAIGRVLGLGSAMRCTGGTIMHDDPRCIFPAHAIGVDDIAALNRRVQGYRP